MNRILAAILIGALWCDLSTASELKVLFLGDSGAHLPRQRFAELEPVMAERGIKLHYTEDLKELTLDNLRSYDSLAVYANIDTIDDDYAKAILAYVEQGGGFVPIHCASFCFRNQPELVKLIGAQFKRHGTGVFQARVDGGDHPITSGFGGFRSWDETYVHHLHHEENRTVLMYRVDREGREPWTWVRKHGRGRVFYTASGHDSRTWMNAGFQNLIERGIRWASGDDPALAGVYLAQRPFDPPQMKAAKVDAAKFDCVDVGPKIPNYTPSRKWGTQGKLKTLMQSPLSPSDSMEHFVTPVGLAVEKYADESNFDSKPIAMTWDERGRLWVCETLDYPNELGKDRDRIRICEDTDGDMVADKFIIFADGLSIPTAIVIARGGAIVQNGTETIFLQDTDGDDVADQRKTLISGWKLGDTHGGVSNFRYGLDNWIWAMQGYNNSRPEVAGQASQSFRQGFWRFKLSTSGPLEVTELEFVRSSDNNTWGLGISEEGLIFGSTANHNPSMFMTIPNRYYESVRGWAPSVLRTIADTHEFNPITEDIRQVDHHGGYTAAAGHALYTARAFPEQWWNQTAFVCGPTGHLVGTFVLSRDGSNFQSESPVNLLASDDQWSAPIMAEVGPDGAVWVIDWYNYIVQHNPTPNGFTTGKGAAYESDLRDKRRGRIYRVVPEQRSRLHPFVSLVDADQAELVDALRHPSMRWRLHAQRLLVETTAGLSDDTISSIRELVADSSFDAVGLNVGAIHALRVLAAIDKLDDDTLIKGLTHPSAGVRRNAIDLLPRESSGLSLLKENNRLLSDPDQQVRLQAILALADMPSSTWAADQIVRSISSTRDLVLTDALTAAAAAHDAPFLKATAGAEDDNEQLVTVARRVAEHLARSEPKASTLAAVIRPVSAARVSISTAILDGLVAGLPSDRRLAAPELDASLASTFDQSAGATQTKLLRLAAQLGSKVLNEKAEKIIQNIAATVEDATAADDVRIAAASDLIGFRRDDTTAVATILNAITPQVAPELARRLLGVVRRSQATDGGRELLEVIPSLSPTNKAVAIDVLLSKPLWAASLLDFAESKKFDLDELTLEQKQALSNFPGESLQARARKILSTAGGIPSADRQRVLDDLMPITKLSGNAGAGRLVFTKACANCHQFGNLGQKVGPNLTGMAVHPKPELLTHIIDPSRSVEGNYRMYQVLTVDGLVVSGMLSGESKTSVTIVDTQAKRQDFLREDIEQLVVSRKSVMPEGFEQQLSRQELTDLLEFLTDTGPYVPYPLDRFATAISTKGMFGSGDNGPDRMVFGDWSPKVFKGIPFVLTDPEGKTTPNVVLLHGPFGTLPPKMPKQVVVPVGTPVQAVHILGGVGGWNFPYDQRKTVSLIVRFQYRDGKSEDHKLLNGVHIADYIRRVDVPESQFAFALGNQQLRYLSVAPKRASPIDTIQFIKGPDNSSPIIMALTIQRRTTE